MAFTLRFPTLFSSFRQLATASRPTYWGECVHCARTTPWYTNVVRGEYRCTACGQDVTTP